MNQLLHTYDWLKKPALVALGAILLAAITNNIIASQLAPYTVPEIPSFALQQPETDAPDIDRDDSRNLTVWANLLSNRCPFGCAEEKKQPNVCKPPCGEGETCRQGECVTKEDEEKRQQQAAGGVPTESDLKVKLLGSMVANNPRYSTALIKLENSQETYVVSPGDILPGNAVITRIRRDRIFVRREDGSIEYITLERTIGGAPTAAGRTTTSSIRRTAATEKPRSGRRVDFSEAYEASKQASDFAGASGGEAGAPNGVQQLDENQYRISREYVEKQLDNPAQLVREVRIQQNYENGDRAGVRLSGMKSDGFYSSLGLESGDVIRSVNGTEINSRSEATQLIERLREGGSVNIVVERNGEQVEKQYEIGN